MRSYAVTEFGGPLELLDAPDPVPEADGALVRVRRSGVCHSDLHIRDGYFDFGEAGKFDMRSRGMKLPHTLGHEVVGEVEALGPDARDIDIGGTYLVHPWIGCGTCRMCLTERENECAAMQAIGVVQPGGFATHMPVPSANWLVPLDGIDLDQAAPYACSGVTVYSALKKALPIEDDEWLVIIGAGGLGLNAVAIARAMGAPQIVSVDIDDAKLVAAREMGADATLNSLSVPDAVAALTEITGGNLMAAVDTVGRPESSHLGVFSLKKAGRYVVVGLYGGTFKMPLPMLPQKALTVRGSYVGSKRELGELLGLVAAGKVKAMPVELRSLSEAEGALGDLAEGRVTGRIVLTGD